MAKLILEHPHSGLIKQAPVGYSWTTLLFPALPALLRGDYRCFIIQLLLDCTLFIPIFIFPSIYNKQYVQRLLSGGYKVQTTEGITIEDAKRRLDINLPELGSPNA